MELLLYCLHLQQKLVMRSWEDPASLEKGLARIDGQGLVNLHTDTLDKSALGGIQIPSINGHPPPRWGLGGGARGLQAVNASYFKVGKSSNANNHAANQEFGQAP